MYSEQRQQMAQLLSDKGVYQAIFANPANVRWYECPRTS